MRAFSLSVVAILSLIVAVPRGTTEQPARVTAPLQPSEMAALKALVDGVAAGKPAGGQAWLNWDGHFLRAAEGQVYVPFTIKLDDVEGGFESVALYVRVMPRGTGKSAVDVQVRGSDIGVPVSVPERQFARGAPTAGEASARLGLMTSELSAVKHPFEGFFLARTLTSAATMLVRRALVVAPGEYDLYVAVRERSRVGRPDEPKSAVMKRALTVPGLSGDGPTMSSVILAEQITALEGRRLTAAQQTERPYAMGSAEIVPVSSANLQSDDMLSVVFFVYNVSMDKNNLPDVTVEYRFHQMSTFGKLFGETAPQRFSAAHMPPAFDARAGRQLAVTQVLPLASFPPDQYELEISVTDNLSGRTSGQVVRFTVGKP